MVPGFEVGGSADKDGSGLLFGGGARCVSGRCGSELPVIRSYLLAVDDAISSFHSI